VMVKKKNDTLQGTLALLVLKSLDQGPMHGWGITLHIESISNQVLRVEEGSLYPALHRMEQERWIASEWGLSENNRRARFYKLTAMGRKQLAAEQRTWQEVTNAVALVLNFSAAKG
jgi:PadR family transcriptional regulator PadR